MEPEIEIELELLGLLSPRCWPLEAVCQWRRRPGWSCRNKFQPSLKWRSLEEKQSWREDSQSHSSELIVVVATAQLVAGRAHSAFAHSATPTALCLSVLPPYKVAAHPCEFN